MFPVTKPKWFYRKLIQYETWYVSELQNWIRVARRIIRKNNQLLSKSNKMTPASNNDNKRMQKTMRSINHTIVSPIPLEDLKKEEYQYPLVLPNYPQKNTIPTTTSTISRSKNDV